MSGVVGKQGWLLSLAHRGLGPAPPTLKGVLYQVSWTHTLYNLEAAPVLQYFYRLNNLNLKLLLVRGRLSVPFCGRMSVSPGVLGGQE